MITKKRRAVHPRKKQKIFERDGFKCVNCSKSGDFNALEVDHVISIKDGGTNEDSNLQTLCYRCNMNKLHKKEVTNKYFLNLSPLERLDVIKKRLVEYKHLSYAEFKVIFTQDELFNRLRLSLLYLEDLFRVISGTKRENSGFKSRFSKQRDILINILCQETGKTLREVQIILQKSGITLSFQQISKICVSVYD